MKTKNSICIIIFRKAFYLSLFGVLFISTSLSAQDIHFSQFDETTMQLNPADAGVQHDVRIVTNYKNQWQTVGSPYKTFALSGDTRLLRAKKNHIGLGFDFFSDKAGDAKMSTNQGNLTLSGIIPVNDKSVFAGGLMVGVAQRSTSVDGLQWGNQYNGLAYDAALPTGETVVPTSYTFVDVGAGLQYSFGMNEMYISANDARKVNIGVAVFHPHQPSYSFYGEKSQKLYMKFVLHGDAAIGVKNSNLVLKPSYMILIQGPTKEITPGLTFQYVLQEGSKYTGNKKPAAFSLGAYYRTTDAFIGIAKFEYSNYAIGFSYDFNLSKLKTVSKARGGFEISLRFISPSAFGKRSSSKSKFI
jgi:type IX secretion system PorP/SprF family membrane protein